MAELRITDLVDEKQIELLKELDTKLLSLKETFINVTKELCKGLKMEIETPKDLEKLFNTYTESATKARKAQEELAIVQTKQNEIIAKTTNTISKELAEIEKANAAKRESFKQDQQAVTIAKDILGTREQNIKRLVDINSELRSIAEAQKSLNDKEKNGIATTQQLSAKRQELLSRERELKSSKQELNTILNNEEKMNQAAAGSYTQLSLQLEMMKKAYKQLNEEEKSSTIGTTLGNEIQTVDARLKDLSASMGEHQRNTGNYAIANGSVKQEMRELVEQLAGLTIQYRSLSAEEKKSEFGVGMKKQMDELTLKASTLKDAIMDVNTSVKAGASDTAAFDSISQGVNLLVSGYGAAVGASKMLGLSQEDLAEIQTKLQTAFVLSNALTQAQTVLQRESSLMMGIATIQERARAKAINISTAAQGKNVIATKAAAVAQRAFNLVANANPYVLLATAIVTVVGVLSAFAIGSKKSKEEQARLNTELENTKKQIKGIKDNADFNTAIAEASGQSVQEIRKMRLEALKASEEIAHMRYMSVLSNKKATKEQIADAKQLSDEAYGQLQKYYNDCTILEAKQRTEAKNKGIESAKEAAKERLEALKQGKQLEIDLLDDGLDKEIKLIQANYKKQLTEIKGKSKEETELRALLLQKMNQEIEAKQVDYARKRELMITQTTIDIAREGSKEMINAKLKLLGLEMNEEMEAAKINGMEVSLIQEKYLKQRNELLQEYASSQIADISDTASAEQVIRDFTYQKDLLSLKKMLAEKQITQAEYNEKEYQLTLDYARKTNEAAIDALELQLQTENLSAQDRASIADELQRLKSEMANKEAEFEIEAIERVTQADEDSRKARLKSLNDWVQMASQAVGTIGDLIGTIYDGKIEKIEAEQEANDEAYNKDIERIELLAENGTITEEEAEVRKRAAKAESERKNEELEKKKVQMQRKQAVWDKAVNIAQAGMATALAVTKALPNFILAAIIGAMGAVQIATIAATPIPAYAEGTKDSKHKGGLALVGDGGKSELVVHNGMAWITPDTPTIVDLPQGSEVYPDFNDLPFAYRFENPDKQSVIIDNKDVELRREMQGLRMDFKKWAKGQRKSDVNTEFNNYIRRRL